MGVDEELLAAARAAQARVVEAERGVDLARAEFRYSVRKLHLAGASLRELGEALGLSHQRVHQLVEEAGGGWRSFTARGERPRRGDLRCSFCGKPQKETRKLIAGTGGVAICDACAAKAGQVLETGKVAATPLSSIKPVPVPAAGADPSAAGAAGRCSFCGKGRDQVDGLAMAAGTTTAGVSICAECVALCHEIVNED
jgi:ClpX C4-type zinc finger